MIKKLLSLISLFLIISCTSVVYIKPEIPDLNLTPLQVPSIDKNSESWQNKEFVEMVDYASKLEIQLDAYKQYIKEINK